MKGIVDRIEVDILVLEVDGEYLELDIGLFPTTIKEGDIVVKEGNKYLILDEETDKRTKEMDGLLDSLFNKYKD